MKILAMLLQQIYIKGSQLLGMLTILFQREKAVVKISQYARIGINLDFKFKNTSCYCVFQKTTSKLLSEYMRHFSLKSVHW